SVRFAHSRKRTSGTGPRFSCSRRKPAGPFLSSARPLVSSRRTLGACDRLPAVLAVSQLLAGGSYLPPRGAPAQPECLGGAFRLPPAGAASGSIIRRL